jgi:predicted TIM-barrel fold metal-dependent hydrolase
MTSKERLMQPPYPIIDAHIHIQPWEQMAADAAAAMSGRPDFEAIKSLSEDGGKLIEFMDERNIEKLVLINYISPLVTGPTEAANEKAAALARQHPERLLPLGGIDPRRVRDVAAEMDHLLGDLQLSGIKIHPPHQLLHANDYHRDTVLRGLATVYEKCIEYEVPVVFHTGTSVFPRARNKFANPMDLEDVLIDFPELTVVIAHGGRPLWMDETLFLLRRFPNAYLDISSVPPKKLLDYFPWIERLAVKSMFGSDWPGPGVKDPGENAADVYALPISEEAKRLILRETALRIFRRGPGM